MRVAIFTAGLFLLSYLAVNRGLGDNPIEIVIPLIVVLGFVGGVRWLRRRGRQEKTQSGKLKPMDQFETTGERDARRSSAGPTVRRPGAKKLF